MGSSDKNRSKRKSPNPKPRAKSKPKAKSKGNKSSSSEQEIGDETVSDHADLTAPAEYVPQTAELYEEMTGTTEQGSRVWLVASIALFAIWLVVLTYIAYRVSF